MYLPKLSKRPSLILFPLMAAAILSGCNNDEQPPPDDAAATVLAGVSTNGSGEEPVASTTTTAESAMSTPTSASAELATEVAARHLPILRQTVGRSGFENGSFQLPSAVAVSDNGEMFVLDTTGIQVFDKGGAFLRKIAGGPIIGATGIAVAADGSRLYVAVRPPPGAAAGTPGAAVVVLDASIEGEAAALDTIGTSGPEVGQLAAPAAVRLGPEGTLYVADTMQRRVEVYDVNGTHLRSIGEQGEARGQFTSPRAIGIDTLGRLLVGQGDHFLIQVFGPDGTYQDTFGKSITDETLFRIGGIAIDEAGRAYISRAANHYIQIFDSADGQWLGDYGTVGQAPGQFNTPLDLLVHDSTLYVVDQQNHRVQIFDLAPPP